jgi:hypothetical protein
MPDRVGYNGTAHAHRSAQLQIYHGGYDTTPEKA